MFAFFFISYLELLHRAYLTCSTSPPPPPLPPNTHKHTLKERGGQVQGSVNGCVQLKGMYVFVCVCVCVVVHLKGPLLEADSLPQAHICPAKLSLLLGCPKGLEQPAQAPRRPPN